jgi:hypothetical protein
MVMTAAEKLAVINRTSRSTLSAVVQEQGRQRLQEGLAISSVDDIREALDLQLLQSPATALLELAAPASIQTETTKQLPKKKTTEKKSRKRSEKMLEQPAEWYWYADEEVAALSKDLLLLDQLTEQGSRTALSQPLLSKLCQYRPEVFKQLD